MKTQISSVNFHGHALTVITHVAQQLVAMKPVVEAIGLDWRAQLQRIKRHPVLSQGVVIIATPSGGGDQQATCLPLDMLNGWLFGVDANRVRAEIRDTLIMYQRECYQVLAAYWQKGEAVNPRPQTDLVGSVIGSTGLIVLDRVIDQKAQAVDKGMRRSFKHTMKSRLRNRFNVQRTDLIPADELADACNFVAAYTLEGEYLGKGPEKAHLDIHFPIDTLTSCGRKGMRQPRNANTDFLNVALSDLRELHNSPCEEVLNILHNAGYNVEGAWWELRTYRNKLAYLMPLIESMASLAAEPHEYVVDKAS